LWFYYTATTGNSPGAFVGQSATLANAGVSGAYVMAGCKTAGLNFTAPTDLDFQGGDKILATMSFGNEKLAPHDLIVSSIDPTLVAMLGGGTTNTTNSQYTKFSTNPNRTTPVNVGLCYQQRQTDIDGTPGYHLLWIPKAQARIHLGGFAFRGEADTTIRITPVMSKQAHTGQSFGTGGLAMDLEEDRTDHYSWFSPDPVHVVAFRADGTATSFSTIYKPLSTVITLNATLNEALKNTTPTALTSLTLAGLATLPAAGSAADLWVLTHTTRFVGV
jgi:hypothetical protein